MRLSAFLAPVCLLSVLALAGCSAVQQQGAKAVHINLQGRAMGGEQPITAATVQLYQVGTITDGGGATPLINQVSTPVTTSDGTGVMNSNANAGNNYNQLSAGYFTITGDYTCSGSTLVYLATIGGNPGIGTNNAQEQIAALGPCSGLNSNTYITINEITTVGAVKALLPYMSSTNTYSSVSSTPAHASALATAFTTASEYVNTSNGIAPGPNLPGGYDAASNDLRALANVVQNCVNSNGSVANGSNCGTFFTDAQGTASSVPGDTVTALYDVFSAPTNNVTTIFNLQGTTPAFEPTNNNAPPDWTLPILQVPAMPTISPAAGPYTTVQSVTITDTDTDGTNAIYYTLDGSTPSATNGTLYSGAFTAYTNETVKAIDIDDSRLTSSVASNAYTFSGITPPTVSLASISAGYGSTTGVTLAASSNNNGSVVTFGTTGSIGGSFSPTTCVIASGSCSVTYYPSGTLGAGTYTNDLTASFSAHGTYSAANGTGTLTVDTGFTTTTIANFTGPNGSDSYAGLAQGADGNFYGTTVKGGANGDGTVFELVPNGTNSTLTILHSFGATSTDGSQPYATLAQGADGNFYGTTLYGGANGKGTVFQIAPNGTNSTLTILYSFGASSTDGAYPVAGLVQGADGNFYGTTVYGGAQSDGTIFELVPNGPSSTLTILHSFSGGTTDGSNPYGTLVQGADGNFYGVTLYGGAHSDGTVFEIVPNGTNSPLTTLHSFGANSTDGQSPVSGLVQGADGNFYGTTIGGGANAGGTVFEIAPNGTNSTLTILYSFGSTSTDGGYPRAGLVRGSDGNFYGAALNGGAHSDGTVFKLTPNGINSTLTTLYSFGATSTDGQSPEAGLVQGTDGNFYGTTSNDTTNAAGTVFEVAASPALAAPVTFSVPSSVASGGSFTLSYAVANAYSASPNDGTFEQCFAGVHDSSGNYTKLGTFTGSASSQNATLTAPSTTGTYTLGVTCGGMESSTSTLTVLPVAATPTFLPVAGTYSSGQTVYLSSTTPGASIYYTTDNSTPTTSSTLYNNATGIPVSATETLNAIAVETGYFNSAVGTAAYTILVATAPTVSLSAVSAPFGSTAGVTITATGNDTGSVVTFGTAGSIDGSFSPTTCTIASGSCSVSYIPSGTLAVGTYSNDLTASFAATSSYAASSATSTLIIDGTFTLTTLHAFANTTADQIGGLGMVQGPDGNFYGVDGGDYYYNHTYGTVFELTPNGASSTITVLHTFSGSSDGEAPSAPLVWGSDGALYGTTYQGGSAGNGTVFKIVPNGTNSTFTVLHAFAGGSDGGSPVSALVQGTDGNLYGTTPAGGTSSYGTIFQIAPDGTYTQNYTFNGTNDGQYPYSPLVQAGNGTFYGTTNSGGNGNGNIYQFVPNGASSTVTSVYSFQNGTDGASPFGGLAVGADGNLYGTTNSDPTYYAGTVFKFNRTSTSLTTLYQFTGGNDGGNVGSNLVLGSDGNFYGSASGGGAYSWGTLFSISPSGTFTTVYSFTGGNDGGISPGPLVQGADGNFYASTSYDGAHGYGTLFELLPSPTFSAPVTLTVPASVTHGASFTLGYAVSNAYGDTVSRCFATNNGGDTTGWTGVLTSSPTVTNASLTAPATTGTYIYSLTCGGVESGFATLNVQ